MLTGQARLDNMREGAYVFGAFAVASVVWLVFAVRAGRVLVISRARLPYVADRKSDPTGFWSMIAFICFLVLLFAWGSVYLAYSS